MNPVQQVIQSPKMKTCKNIKGHIPACGISKPIDDFYSGKSICKECFKRYSKQNSDKKKQEINLLAEQLAQTQKEIEIVKLEDQVKINEMEEKISYLISTDDDNIDVAIQRLQYELLEKEKEIKYLKDKLDSAVMTAGSKLDKLDELENKSLQQKGEIISLEDEVRILERENTKLKTTINDYSGRVIQMDKTIRELKKKLGIELEN